MENRIDEKNIKEQISNAIKSGQVKMRPKWHFILRTALFICGMVILALLLLYLCSFVIFIMRQSGVWFAPTFGWRGWYLMLVYSPWLLLVFIIFFMVILEILTSHFAFAYRYPLLYLWLAIIFLMIMGGYIMAGTSLHEFLSNHADNDDLPLAGGIYRKYGRQKLPDIHRGKIEQVSPAGFTIKDPRGESLQIIVSSSTNFAAGEDFFPGETVVIFGREFDHTVKAQGINKLMK